MRPRTAPQPLAAVLAAPPRDADGAIVDVSVTGISLDSRNVVAGDLYAALPGHLTHGARFAAAAVAAGAAAVVTDAVGAPLCVGLGVPVVVLDDPRAQLGGIAAAVYGNPARALQLLGVTGTNGKTTVAAMVDGGLRAAGRVTGVIGTVGVRIADVPHRGVRTTPEATDLQALLAVMRDAGVASVVMEVSSIAIQEHRIDGIHYEVAAFTHLSQDHLDYHGTMEEYFLAKAALFTPERAGRGVVGVDDEWGRRLAQEAAVPVDTWSMASAADWTASGSSSHRTFVGPGGERTDVRVPLPGAYNVANALCAFAMLRRAGVPADAAAAGIAEAEVPGRMQVVDTAGPVRGIVDYAHSPDAIARVLQALRDESDGRLIVVVGAGGDRDRTKRPLMGETAARLADVLVITDDNPRSEDPAAIRAAVREGAERVSAEARAEVHVEGDRAAAVATGVDLAQPGDVLVLLGKGHEQGQEAGGVIVPFDDATVLAAALHARWPR